MSHWGAYDNTDPEYQVPEYIRSDPEMVPVRQYRRGGVGYDNRGMVTDEEIEEDMDEPPIQVRVMYCE